MYLAHLSLGITDRFWILCNVLYNIEEIIFITFYIDDENQVIRELVLFLQNQRKAARIREIYTSRVGDKYGDCILPRNAEARATKMK